MINNVEGIVVFLGLIQFFDNYLFSRSRNVQVTFVENPQMKTFSFFKITNIDV